jgi:hypothetical protein
LDHQDADPLVTADVLYRRAELGFLEGILTSEEVRELSEKACEVYQAAYWPVSLYNCLNLMARSYLKDQLYSDAIKVITNMEQLANGANIPSLYLRHLCYTQYMKGIGRWDESLVPKINLFLQASTANGDALNLVTGLEELAEVYVHDKEWVRSSIYLRRSPTNTQTGFWLFISMHLEIVF